MIEKLCNRNYIEEIEITCKGSAIESCVFDLDYKCYDYKLYIRI